MAVSYILEALKRADAERERGAVPGLHAQPFALGEVDDRPRRPASHWRWVVLGFLIGLSGLVAGWWFARGRDAQVAAAPPLPAVERRAAPGVAPGAVPAVPAVPVAAAPTATAPPATPRPAVQATVPAIAAPAIAALPRKAAPAVPAAAPPQQPPATAGGAAPRVPHFSELPENIRREIPQLAVGGAMYSENRANRMLIMNGQILHEGDQPVPGLVLEQIRPKQAVLNYKGQRYEINF